MPSLVDQPWFWPAVAVAVGLPILLIVLSEVGSVLRRRGNPAYSLVRLLRNFILPTAAVAILLGQITQSVGSTDFTWTKLIITLFGFLAILFILNAFNLALFTNAEKGTWRERLPSIFVDIARIVLIAIGLAILFKLVWNTDVGGLFTALGVTSIVIGLALQGAIGSVVSGLLLLFEQPFRLGDHLEAGGVRGRVVEVNWRAVHIDTGNGIQIIPNASLAGSSFTNLSTGDGSYTVTTAVTFTTDDSPSEVTGLLVAVAQELPGLYPDTTPVAIATGGPNYSLSFEVRGPGGEGEALAILRSRLWYAARRAGLGLDGDSTDSFVTPERTLDALRAASPLLQLSADDIEAVRGDVSLERYAAGERVFHLGEVPPAILFMLAGTAALTMPTGDGSHIPIARIEPGDYLGQTAITREALRTSALAVTEIAVLRVPVATLDGLVRTRPRLAREFGAIIEKRRDQAKAALAEWPGSGGGRPAASAP